ncbi:MAG: 2OG-Fe(II) oxygenase [Acidobacteriota bacterium]|nr:2OG-Fe(II) oxygenase [Acidobacteriota bacterium]
MPSDPPIPQPVIEVLDDPLPADLFATACAVCTAPRWEFGHESQDHDPQPFWAMDLTGVPAFDSIWEQMRPQCEALAGRQLRVIRQYATGHTYGLGGRPHFDDTRPGCFTLLLYAVPEWRPEWDGETMFFDEAGEAMRAVKPRPNRAVLFDSRIVHAGRAPSRGMSGITGGGGI